jgi:glycosyltransferase involved in cell wall biosynthesis
MVNQESSSSAKPLLSICCIAYNHEKFIKDALEGFLLQKTDFPIEIIIQDDASTDNTAEIIRSFQGLYPGLVNSILQQENQFSKGLSFVLKNVYGAAQGKYIALCEGDDYWTDPLKLQKQVDFMEAHPECSLCCHKVQVKYEGNEEKNHLFPDLEGDQIFTRDEMYQKYISATCSVMFRREKIDELISFLDGFKVGDMPLYSFYLQFGKFGYIDQVMATYRKHEDSYWHPHYQEYRFPVLFDTFTKIKSRLKIHDSPALNSQISYYADELLKKYFSEKNFKAMRSVIHKNISSVQSAKKHRRVRFWKYALISHFPWLYLLYKRLFKRSQNEQVPDN